jgi:hypothetical protein
MSKMSKQEIDRVITENWPRLQGIIKSYINKAKLDCDESIIGHAYEELINKSHKIETAAQAQSYFLRIAYISTVWKNSSYQLINESKEMPIIVEDWMNFEPIYSEHISWEKEYEIIEEFLAKATLEEKLVYTLMSIGYNTSSKLSDYTGIPRTTCYLIQKRVKDKIKELWNIK